MPEIKFNEKRTFLGRNGKFASIGIAVFGDSETITIEPITSKDTTGRCCIELPANESQKLIDAINKVGGNLATPQEISRAREEYEEEGRIEIDDNAAASRNDEEDGCYVQAWIWVADKKKETEEETQPAASVA